MIFYKKCEICWKCGNAKFIFFAMDYLQQIRHILTSGKKWESDVDVVDGFSFKTYQVYNYFVLNISRGNFWELLSFSTIDEVCAYAETLITTYRKSFIYEAFQNVIPLLKDHKCGHIEGDLFVNVATICFDRNKSAISEALVITYDFDKKIKIAFNNDELVCFPSDVKLMEIFLFPK